jgi:hypothetical protein
MQVRLRGGRGTAPLDRRGPILRGEVLRLLFAGLIVAIAACATAPEATAPVTRDSLRALRWIAPEADKVRALTTAPVACAMPEPRERDDASLKRSLGRIAFESPALLGGAAARMGLSCASCHINGRGNPDFLVEGISGAAGTADVSSNIFSKVRGNGAFDPIPIPDLAARDGNQIRDRNSKPFHDKVHGLIVEEFDGQEPPAYVFDAVLAYLDSLDVAHCADPAATETVEYLDDYGAVLTASVVLVMKDVPPDVALFYIRVARERLGRLHERFIGKGDAPARLQSLSARFAEAADSIRAGEPAASLGQDVAALIGPLFAEADRSLYNPGVLRAALAQ